jgi:transcriptional regulator with GAF, ATPase, and Fis domain
LHKGRFELADGGTIFLDEIGSMAPSLQAKLLRVLENHRFERVGGTHTTNVDVRLIAATNSDLEQDVRRGAFRLDLYYRLQVITIVMPPLRERKEDIGLLARRFACDFCQGNGRRTINVSPEALSLLLEHDWPGNVRELRNAVEYAFTLGRTGHIQADDLPESLRRRPGSPKPTLRLREALEEAKKQIIIAAFAQAGGSYTGAAAVLGVHPNNLFRMVRKMGLRETLTRASKPRLPAARQAVTGGFSH